MSVKNVASDLLKPTPITDLQVVHLPVTHSLTPMYVFSLVIAFLMSGAAITGILFQSEIYPTEELILTFAPVDVFHLVIGLPILLGSMWLARRGQLVGLLCWPGTLLYVLYSYVTNLIGVPFGVLFLPYLLLVTFSAYTLAGVVASIDGEAVRERLSGIVPVKATGGVLVGLTSLFIIHAVAEIVTAIIHQEPAGALSQMLWIADLTTITPMCLVGGILVWQRKVLGYVGGTGLLLAYGMLFMGTIPVMAFPAFHNAASISWDGIIMMLITGTICLVLFACYVRAAMSKSTHCLPGAG